MNTSKFTQKSMEALKEAQRTAIAYQNMQVEQAHLCHALLAQPEGLIPQLLGKMNIDAGLLAGAMEEAVSRLPKVSGPGREPDKVYVSADVEKALLSGEQQAGQMKDEYLSVEHIWLGLMERPDRAVKPVFDRFQVKRDAFLAALSTVRGAARVTSDSPENTYDALAKYGADLTALARAQKLDPVIGRDGEIRNVIRILSRKTKNNPG